MTSNTTGDDPIHSPYHYTALGAECECGRNIEVIKITERMDFVLGNAVKYILRAPFKGNELEDLKKAQWYLNRAVNAKEPEWHDIGYTTLHDLDDVAEEFGVDLTGDDEDTDFEIKTSEDRGYKFRPWQEQAQPHYYVVPGAAASLQPYLDAMTQTVKQVTHPTFFPGLPMEITETTKEMLQDAIDEWYRKRDKAPMVPEWVHDSFAEAWEQMERDSALLVERVKEKTDAYGAAWKKAPEMVPEVVDTVEWRDPAPRSQAAEAEIAKHLPPRVYVGYDGGAMEMLRQPREGYLWQEKRGEQIFRFDGTEWGEL